VKRALHRVQPQGRDLAGLGADKKMPRRPSGEAVASGAPMVGSAMPPPLRITLRITPRITPRIAEYRARKSPHGTPRRGCSIC